MLTGVNVFRLNFSHGNHDNHLNCIKIIRKVEKELNYQIAILADLQGPKFRIGKIQENIKLKEGAQFRFDRNKILGNQNRAYLSHEEIFNCVVKDSIILIDDGK